jgi:hypothetical protein
MYRITGVTVQFVLISTISMYNDFKHLSSDKWNLFHKHNGLLRFLQIASFPVQMWCVTGQSDGFSPDACDIMRSERHITVEMMQQGAESCFCREIAASY